MTLPASHLSTEAVAALVDGELVPIARTRALAHAAKCAECADAIQDQREAKRALSATMAPALPSGLLDRLSEIPFTAELDDRDGWNDRVLVADRDRLALSTEPGDRMSAVAAAPAGGLGGAAEFASSTPLGSGPALGSTPPLGAAPAFAGLAASGVATAGVAPSGAGESRDDSVGTVAAVAAAVEARARRLRRGLVGAAAGLTIGVLSAAAPQAVAANGGDRAEFQPAPEGDVQPVDFVSSVSGDEPPTQPEPTADPGGVSTLPTR